MSEQLWFVHKFILKPANVQMNISLPILLFQKPHLAETQQIKMALTMDHDDVAPCQRLDVTYMILAVMPLMPLVIPVCGYLTDYTNSKVAINPLAQGR